MNDVCAYEMETVNVSASDSVTKYYNNDELAAVELFKGYSDQLLEFATACCVVFMCVGIPGNLVTIIALAKYEKVRNATAIFIINLSFSDLLFCCFNLPLAASTFSHRSWIHGTILCRMFPFARYALVAVSLFTVLAITVNRYVMIAHPRLYPKLYQPRNIGIMIAVIWISSFGPMIPTWFEKWGHFGLDTAIGSCSILPDHRNRSPKKMLFLTAFILPCITIILCYTRIFFIVRKTTKNSLAIKKKTPKECSDSSSADLSTSVSVRLTGTETSSNNVSDQETSNSTNNICDLQRTITIKVETRDARKTRSDNKLEVSELRRTALRKSMALLRLSLPTRKDRRLGTMILAIMVSFCLCHLPITVTKVLREIKPHPAANIISYMLLYLSSSINPIIYVVMSNEYRKAYKNLIKRQRKAKFSIRRPEHRGQAVL